MNPQNTQLPSRNLSVNDEPETISERKQTHLNLCLNERVRGNGADLSGIRLPYDALFSVSPERLDTSGKIAGIPVSFPLMFGAMTGGTPAAADFNTALRKLAGKYGLAMELGSMRALIHDGSLLSTYGTGEVQALFANIGCSEITPSNAGQILEACKKLGASGLCIHLNGLQEWMQEEGNHAFSCSTDTLSAFIERFPLPVLIKEVGSGIGGECARKIARLPIAGIETASLGGTSWIRIEAMRRSVPVSAPNAEALNDLGYDIVTAIKDCRRYLDRGQTLIASGGISNAVDLVKCLYLGADMAAIAQPLYAVWHDAGEAGLEAFVSEWIEIGKLTWRSTGCRDLKTLKSLHQNS